MWISIDGVEAAGKTTLSNLLAERAGGVISPEFSSTPLATLLRKGVDKDPHIFKRSKLAQTLAFLAEFCERMEESVLPMSSRGEVVIADRGYLSKYAYQHAVLAMDDSFDVESAHQLMRAIFKHIARPDLVVLLECPLQMVEQRLKARGYTVNAERLNFIDRSQELLKELAVREPAVFRFDSGKLSAIAICDQVIVHVERARTRSRTHS